MEYTSAINRVNELLVLIAKSFRMMKFENNPFITMKSLNTIFLTNKMTQSVIRSLNRNFLEVREESKSLKEFVYFGQADHVYWLVLKRETRQKLESIS